MASDSGMSNLVFLQYSFQKPFISFSNTDEVSTIWAGKQVTAPTEEVKSPGCLEPGPPKPVLRPQTSLSFSSIYKMETRTFFFCPGVVRTNTFLFVRHLDKIAKGAV